MAFSEKKGLSHFFKPVKGYVKHWVVEFYTNVQINLESQVVESKVGIWTKIQNKTIVVTPDKIATYLDYERPPRKSTIYSTKSGTY